MTLMHFSIRSTGSCILQWSEWSVDLKLWQYYRTSDDFLFCEADKSVLDISQWGSYIRDRFKAADKLLSCSDVKVWPHQRSTCAEYDLISSTLFLTANSNSVYANAEVRKRSISHVLQINESWTQNSSLQQQKSVQYHWDSWHVAIKHFRNCKCTTAR